MTDQLEYKPDFERARSAWDALWNHEIVNRPCTLVTAARVPSAAHNPKLLSVDGDFEKSVRDCDAYLDSHIFLGEAMPAFRPGFGPEVKRIHGEYDPALLVYDVKTDSLDQGMELLDWLERNT